MPSFENASEFVIHKLIQVENQTSMIEGFKLLQDHVVKGAAHDSGERYDAPKCHPETRTAVLSNIKSWVNSGNNTERVMWLHGPAGAGKSAIAQTTAEDCDKGGKLAASFFFSRLAGRNKKDGLIATLAYQLCVSVPEVKEHVVKNIERNPQIFSANLETQMHWLVVKPLHRDSSIGVIPRLVIIDGLDECEITKDQAEIIESVSTSISSVDSSSGLRVLLVSRPELEIRRVFKKDNISSLCTRIVLDESFNPDKDIELYLRSHFQSIKRQHELGPWLPHSWPSDDSIQELVIKSSGQFIYASTVIHFVSDPEHDPRKRLDTILLIRPVENNDKPYAQLDALYSAILSICKDYTNVAAIFEAMMFVHDNSSTDSILKSLNDLEIFLSLENEIMLLLAKLHSIIDVNNIKNVGIRFYHASMFDYLAESSRSHAFYIDKHEAHVHLSMNCFRLLSNHQSGHVPCPVLNFCLDECFFHFIESDCDDRVSNYICEKRILSPDNSELEQRLLSSVYSHYSEGEHMSMLSRFIECVEHHRKDVKMKLRDIIDAEVLNHLKQYPRQDLIHILYFEVQTMQMGPIAYQLHAIFTESHKLGFLTITRSEIFLRQATQDWFINLMSDIGYINKTPKGIPLNAIYCILDLMAKERKNIQLISIQYLLHSLFTNLPLSNSILYALLEKWNIMKDVLRNVQGNNFVSEIETYIRDYHMRVEEDSKNQY